MSPYGSWAGGIRTGMVEVRRFGEPFLIVEDSLVLSGSFEL
jgi:hypothetical protein